ncbi:MAG TPA: hypothetical protein VGB83_04240 [Actinomycetota bacterium]
MRVTDDGALDEVPGAFGLWDVLAACEEIASWALLDREIDRDALSFRLGIFRADELASARRTIQVVILTAAEVRALIEDTSRADAGRPWPPDPAQLDEATTALTEAARSVAFLPARAARSPETPAEAQRVVTRAMGLVAGTISLSDAQLELNVRWLGDALDGVDDERRRLLQDGADLVFWAATLLLAACEREITFGGIDSPARSAEQLPWTER